MEAVELLRFVVKEAITVAAESVIISGLGVAGEGRIIAGGFRVAGLAVRVLAPGHITFIIITFERGTLAVNIGHRTVAAGLEGIVGFELAEVTTLVKEAAEASTSSVGIAEMELAAVFGVAKSPASSGVLNRMEGALNAGTEGAEDGAGHLHEGEAEEDWNDLDGETKNNAKRISRGSNERPAGELRSAIEEAEHWVENKHAKKEIFPLGEPFFGIW